MDATEDSSSTPPTSGDSLQTLIAEDDVAAFSFCDSGDSWSSFLLQREQIGDDKICFSSATGNLEGAGAASASSSSSFSSSSSDKNLRPFLPFKHH